MFLRPDDPATPRRIELVNIALDYCYGVLSGDVIACKWIKAACQRQLDDLEHSLRDDPDFPYIFDVNSAGKICDFIERLCHVKGSWARVRNPHEKARIRLEPWQVFGLTTFFGWLRRDTLLRRFRTVYEEVARKNAKTTKLAGVGLYLMAADNEPGSEVYSAATTRDQATIVFDTARMMAVKDPELCARFGIELYRFQIGIPGNACLFKPLSADGHTLDGLNVHGGLIDELHAHKSRAVYDVIDTATGSREQPVMWSITTAGFDLGGVCYEKHVYSKKVLNETLHRHNGLGYKVESEGIRDDTWFALIYTLDDGDSPFDEEVWPKANPNLDVSVFRLDIRRKAQVAQRVASALNNFLTKHMNVWCNASEAWMDMRKWLACGDPTLKESDFLGEQCYVGLDLASKVDIAAKMKVFFEHKEDGIHYYLFGTYYLPEERIELEETASYKGWAQENHLTATPGSSIDMDLIEEDLLRDTKAYYVLGVGYDPAQATQLVQHLDEHGVPMVEVRPTVLNFSEAMKEFEAATYEGRVHHNGDPVLTWMVGNVVCKMDAKDNVYPRKERNENKIDGVVAAIMGIRLVLIGGGENIYESRGPL